MAEIPEETQETPAEIPEEPSKPEPAHAPAPPEAEEPPAVPDAPTKRPRGRPPGARNKPKIVVEAPAPPPSPVEPVVMKPPRAKKAAQPAPVAAVAPEPTPHEIFRAAMASWHVMAAREREARGEHYHRLVSGMFQ